jgi:dolichyl-phosphate-mannose--protein O-mannosyl transferase
VSPLARFLRRPVVALAIVAAVAGVLRFHHLGDPPSRVFDEVYYSKDACLYAGHSPRQCDITSGGERYWVVTRADDRGELSWVHPQLGKWAIAAGILGEGNRPFGWRVAAAAAGTAVCVMTALIAWLLFGSIAWTYASGLLLSTEMLNFVQSRTSMLDIFLAFWVVLGFLFLLLDRSWIERRTPARSLGPGAMAVEESAHASPFEQPAVQIPSPIWRPWRFAAGFAFGAACASKWSGTTALAGAAVLAAGWEITRRRRAGDERPIWSTVRLELLGTILAFVLLPVVVYLVSYTRFFVYQSWHPSVFLSMQHAAEQFHSGLHYITAGGQHAHPYESKPWMWLPMTRPVSYYFRSPGTEILSMGHPLLFWTSILTAPYVVWSWIRKHDWRAGFITLAFAAQYLTWFAVASRVQFLFYLTPVTPFMVLAAVYSLKDLWEAQPASGNARPYRSAVIAYLVVYAAMFVFFYPVLTGWHLSYWAWHLRMWMRSWI